MKNENNEAPAKDAQTLMNEAVLEYLRERKSKKRWRLGYRLFILIFILFLVFKANNLDQQGTKALRSHVGLIDIRGAIFSDKDGGADDFAKSMKKAYASDKMKALILRINSNGGSPVQADYMYNLIVDYRHKHPQIPVYAVCVDACLSAAYYIAAAADDIYANPASLVGSIGVLYNGFGFVDIMDKVGVSRRLQTAGAYKGFLDPFSPETSADKQRMQAMLDLIHRQFIKQVKDGRGARLHIDENTFSGLFWTGQQALGIGLIDGFASAGELARKKIMLDNLVDYTQKSDFFERFSKNVGLTVADRLPAALGLAPTLK